MGMKCDRQTIMSFLTPLPDALIYYIVYESSSYLCLAKLAILIDVLLRANARSAVEDTMRVNFLLNLSQPLVVRAPESMLPVGSIGVSLIGITV